MTAGVPKDFWPGDDHLAFDLGPELAPKPPEYREVEVRPHVRKIRIKRDHPPKETTMTTPDDATTVEDLDATAHARTEDPQTSHLAAASVNLRGLQVRVLTWFQEKAGFFPHDATDEEMVEAIQADTLGTAPSPSGLRTARKALERKGLLVATEDRRKTRRGQLADVWTLTRAGRKFPEA